jgi:urease accessory protein
MPQAAVPVFYSLGFVVSTSLIHLVGVGIGFIPWLHWRNRLPMGVTGLMVSAVGVYFLVQVSF